MEIKHNKVIQVRGKYNTSMTPAVQGFITSFKKARLSKRLVKEAV